MITGDLSWLADLCDADRSAIATPAALTFDGQPYTAATNGIAALLLAGEHGYEATDVARQLAGMAAALPAPCATIPLADLRDFIGPFAEPEVRPCDRCQGTRQAECTECEGAGEADCECLHCNDVHTRDCDECDGTGKMDCDCQGIAAVPLDPFDMGGMRFSKRLVARYIRHIPDGEATVHLSPLDSSGYGTKPSALKGDGWILILMPMRRDNVVGVPVFPLAMERAA